MASSLVYGDRLKKISSISDVKRAMHITWYRGGYYHHAIVVDVNQAHRDVTVIQFVGGPLGKGQQSSFSATSQVKGGASVQKNVINWKDMDVDNLYYLKHDACLGDDVVIRNAENMLKESHRYNILESNCEHVATFCKTGKWTSKQADVAKTTAGVILVGLEIVAGGIISAVLYNSSTKTKESHQFR